MNKNKLPLVWQCPEIHHSRSTFESLLTWRLSRGYDLLMNLQRYRASDVNELPENTINILPNPTSLEHSILD